MDGAKKMRVVVTAGPTREHLDPVRYITNGSSGSMGCRIARRLLLAGHTVTMVYGPGTAVPPPGAVVVRVETAREMLAAVHKELKRADVLIMAAAVGDWRPARRHPDKLKRKTAWSLRLVPTPDILSRCVRRKKRGQVMVGFALETDHPAENAAKKMAVKKPDLLIANTISFLGKEQKSGVIFLRKNGRVERIKTATKEEVADRLVKMLPGLVETARNKKGEGTG